MKAIVRWKRRSQCILGVLNYCVRNPKSNATRGAISALIIVAVMLNMARLVCSPPSLLKELDKDGVAAHVMGTVLSGAMVAMIAALSYMATRWMQLLRRLPEVQSIREMVEQDSAQQAVLRRAQKERVQLEAVLEPAKALATLETAGVGKESVKEPASAVPVGPSRSSRARRL